LDPAPTLLEVDEGGYGFSHELARLLPAEGVMGEARGQPIASIESKVHDGQATGKRTEPPADGCKARLDGSALFVFQKE
jgi:hypothetical protein